MAAISEKTIRERQRLAWILLLGSFFFCMSLTIAVPVVAGATLQNATVLLDVLVQANQGTVRIDNESGVGGAVIVGGPGQTIEPGSSIVTGSTETAVVLFTPPNVEQRLLRLQVYSNTIVRLQEAETPRFSLSDRLHEIGLKVESGRLLLTVPAFGERSLFLQLNTPQGEVLITNPGEYEIIVTNEATQVTVQEGSATVTAVAEAATNTIILESDQRAEVPTGGGPIGPLPTERNLIVNNDFSRGRDHWTFFAWRVERADQPKGSADVVNDQGEPRLRIVREGIGHADLLVRQTIRADVTDLSALNLAFTFRIMSQSLDVCGVQGSECPLFLRINYVDENGITQTWQHGFYAQGEIVDGVTPDACISCAVVQSDHERVPLQQDYFYEVELRAELARQGFLPPRFIESIELVASGHAFEVEVLNVDMLVSD